VLDLAAIALSGSWVSSGSSGSTCSAGSPSQRRLVAMTRTWAGAQQRPGQLARVGEHVLAVVDHQELRARAEILDDRRWPALRPAREPVRG
jgi:hypothetical protein